MAGLTATADRVRARTAVFYVALVVAAVAIFLLIRWQGMGLEPAPAGAPSRAFPTGHPSSLAQFMVALAVVAAHGLGALGERWLKQPPVIGEIVAGILLGPSLLQAMAPGLVAVVLPPSVVPSLGLISKVGVVLFLFVVGLELDGRLLRHNSHAVLAISHASIIVPFLLGSALALWCYPRYGPQGVGFTAFALFFGISLSVTAFPVLARILRDRKIHRTELGITALACAAVDDATAWTLLAFVVGVVRTDLGEALRAVPLVAAYLLVMFVVVRPLLRRLARSVEESGSEVTAPTLAVVFVGLLLSASATEWIGIHALFGAFLFGAVMPHTGRLAEGLRARLEDVVVVLLLPAFFAVTGLRTEIGLLRGAADWLVCGVIILAATAGKWGGSYVAARLAGLDGRQSAAIGVLMNTRGLMELIVLNVGLDLGVLTPRLFAMLVLMALVTTFLTSPILGLLVKTRHGDGSGEVRVRGLGGR
jgi:Kef-type K+ transport system membrane component KefB